VDRHIGFAADHPLRHQAAGHQHHLFIVSKKAAMADVRRRA
jgi:hypothetical protein